MDDRIESKQLFGDATEVILELLERVEKIEQGEVSADSGDQVSPNAGSQTAESTDYGSFVADEHGITFPDELDSLLFLSADLLKRLIYNIDGLRYVELVDLTNYASNGDFETGDFSGWTESDSGGLINIGDDAYEGNYSAAFSSGADPSTKLTLGSLSSAQYLVVFYAKADDGITSDIFVKPTGGTSIPRHIIADGRWHKYYVVLPAGTGVDIYISGISGVTAIDNVEVYKILRSTEVYINGGPYDSQVALVEIVNGIAEKRWFPIPKSSNQTIVSHTSLTNDSELRKTLPAFGRAAIRGKIWFITPAAADFKFQFTCGSATLAYIRWSYMAPGTTTMVDGKEIAVPGASNSILGSTTEPGYIEFDAIVIDDGTENIFRFRWAQNTSNAGNTTVKEGSYIEYMILD